MVEDPLADGRETRNSSGLYLYRTLCTFLFWFPFFFALLGFWMGQLFWGEGYDRYPFCMAGTVWISFVGLDD